MAQSTKISFWQTSWGKGVQRLVYLIISGALASVLAYVTKDNMAFGIATPVIYFVVKTASDVFNKNIPNSMS
jgi:hypothetical protein